MSGEHWLGIDLGGTKILGGIFADGATPLARAKEPTPFDEGPAAVIEKIDRLINRLLDETKVDRASIGGMGFSAPGQINPNSGFVKFAPNLGWRDVDLPSLFPKTWTWPTFIENDVRLGTFGEWKFGAAQNATHVLGVFPGTGVGGCLILDGKIYHGFNFNAGEIGHMIVHWRKGTTLEAIAGRRNLMKWADKQLADAPKKVRKAWKGVDLANVKSSQLFEFYQKDDPLAVQLIDDAARAIGAGIGSCINLLSPEVIVLGGGLTEAFGEVLSERVWEIAGRYALPGATEGVKFVTAALGDDAGIVGAAAYARSRTAKI
ncbi:MAG: ROK family protein [Gemmataceae bacterium]